jgi:hypothetical protein
LEVPVKFTAVIAGLVAAIVVPVGALAQTAPASDKQTAAHACKALLAKLGEQTFKETYGTNDSKSNAMGKCVSRSTRAEQQNRRDAVAACTAEQQDASFAAGHGGKSFAEFYGNGKKNADALKRCVQAKRQTASRVGQADVVSAARACKAERQLGEAAFLTKYGTNANKANAFGKCVAKLASD